MTLEIEVVLPSGFKETEIGPIPVEWEVVQIKDMAEVKGGGTPSTKKPEYWNGTILWLTPSDVTSHRELHISRSSRCITEAGLKRSSAKLMPPGTVMMTSRATIGEVVICDVPMATNQGFINLVVRPERLVNEFLAYWITWRKEYLKELGTGTTFKEVSKGVFRTVRIPLPPLPEQRRIAHVLSAIQRAIAAQDDLIAAACEVKRSLMQRLFTYGPGPEPAPTKETEIGEVPEHWRVVRLKDVMRDRIQNGAFIKREQFGDGVPFLNVADTYKSTVVNVRTLKRVRCSRGELEKFGLQAGDLIFVRSSLKREGIGQCIIVEGIEEPTIYDCHLMRVKPDTSTVVPKFLAYYSLSPQGKKDLITRSKTTTMTTINQAGLAGFLVPLPPLQEQQVIAHSIEATECKIEAEGQRKAALQALFKTMLHQLMSGQLRTSEPLNL